MKSTATCHAYNIVIRFQNRSKIPQIYALLIDKLHKSFLYWIYIFWIANLSFFRFFFVDPFAILITINDYAESWSKTEERENYRCSREIGINFGGVHNGELYRRKMVDTRAGRLQGLRAPPQINISFQPRQPPTATHPLSPRILPTPRSLPFVFCRFPRDLAYLRLAILHPIVFSLVSPPFCPSPRVFFAFASFAPSIVISLFFLLQAPMTLSSRRVKLFSHARRLALWSLMDTTGSFKNSQLIARRAKVKYPRGSKLSFFLSEIICHV